jgi:dolichol-phosphate mannosyltransferase
MTNAPPPAPPLTIICPAYNEEGAIAQAVEDVARHVFPIVPGAQLLVINDGSRDSTGCILDEIAAADSRVRIIHKPNGGHGPALRAGLEAARGEYLMLIDSDRQMPLDEFASHWRDAQSRHAVFALRRERDDPAIRLVLTRWVRRVACGLFGVRPQSVPDLNVPYKILRSDLWQAASPLIPPDTLAPSLFLAIVAHAGGWNVLQVPLTHRPRTTGEVSIRRWRLFRFCLRGLGQLLAFRIRTWRHGMPRAAAGDATRRES